MAESLILFDSVINSRWFLRTSIILFLNKIDVFKNKLPKVCSNGCLHDAADACLQVPLEKYFPEYTGGADINKAAKYILWRFMQANRARLSVYPQYVLARGLSLTISLIAAAQSDTSDGHEQRAAGLRGCQGDDPSERTERLGYPVTASVVYIRGFVTLWVRSSGVTLVFSR